MISSAQTESATADGAGPWTEIKPRQRWWTVTVLTLMVTLSFMDRNILKLLVEPVKADLGATDLQISLLVGLSFSALYSICCVPFGYLADIVNRRKLIGAAVFCWSMMGAMCGLATNYWQLFFGRMGLGVGEAALQPAAASLIRDSFPPASRPKAYSIVGAGPLLGGGVAMLVGGVLFAFASNGGTAGWPLIGHLRPWQFALLTPAVGGMLLALLLFTIKEPARPQDDAASRPTFGDMFAHMKSDRAFYLLIFTGPTLWSLAISGWTGWTAAAIGRTWGLTPGQIGPIAGPLSLVCTPIGLFVMGHIMEKLSQRGRRNAVLEVTLSVQALHMIPALLIFMAPTIELMWTAYGASMLITGTMQVAANTLLAERTPGRLMGKTVAVFNMIQNFLGLAIGPTVYALASRYAFGGEGGLVPAMMTCYSVFIGLSVIPMIVLMAMRSREAAAA